jgi:hypothetical protein
MDVLLIALMLFATLWSSSVPSSVYLLQACAMVVKILFNQVISRRWLLPGLTTSACLAVFKVVLVALYYRRDDLGFFEDNDTLLELLGVYLSSHKSFQEDMARTLFPDLIVLGGSIIGMFGGKLVLLKKSSYVSLVTLVLVLATGLTRCSVADLSYILCGTAWVFCWSYKVLPKFSKVAAAVLSSFACLRVLLSYLYFITGSVFSASLATQLGVLEISSSVQMVNYCLFYVLQAFLLYLYKPAPSQDSVYVESLQQSLESAGLVDQDSSEDDRQQPLIPPEARDGEETNLETISRTVKELFNSARVLMQVSHLLLFVWIVHYRSLICLALMVWLFYSVLEVITSNVLRSLQFTVLPVLVLMHIGCYLANIFHFGLNPYFGLIEFEVPVPNLALQSIVIISFLLTYRAYANQTSTIRRQATVTPTALAMTFLLQNSDKVTLSVVFLVGLSAINLLHTGLMVICIVFMTNNPFAKKHWTLLVLYTMLVLCLKYLWVLLIPFTAVLDSNTFVYQIIGLPYTHSQTTDYFGYVPQDYLVWLLFLSEIMQLSAYRAVKNISSSSEHLEQSYRDSRFFKCTSFMYVLLKSMHIWIVYVFILLVILVSDLNLINFVRFLLLLCYLIIHIASADSTLEVGYFNVKRSWFIIEIYSGVVLAARYIYQFAVYTDVPVSPYMKFIGIDIYKTNELYEFMVGDCLILIATVLASRAFVYSLQERTRLRASLAGDIEVASLVSSVVPQPLAIFTKLYALISEPFNKLLGLIFFCLSIYWRLSASMGVVIVILSLHFYSLSNLYVMHNRRKTPYLSGRDKWNMRYHCWEALFYLVILSCCLEFSCAFINDTLFTSAEYHSALWYMAVLGFAKAESVLLFKVYGYFLMLLMLITERHCLEYLKATRDIERPIEEPKAEFKYREAVRVIYEESICMLMLLLAFFKVTWVSIVYVLAVLASKLLVDGIRSTKFLSNVLIIMICTQYGLFYSNINNGNTPPSQSIPSDSAPFYLPWYSSLPLTSDDVTFLSLGPNFAQVSSTFFDMLILLYVHIYFTYLGRRRQPLDAPMESELESISHLNKTRDIIYSSAHYFILVVVLIFVVQSTGLLSIIYLGCCLFCLAKINYSIKSERSLLMFAKIIKSTLFFLMVDFVTAILFQMPFTWLHEHSSPNWQDVVGLKCLWACGEDSKPADADEYYYRVMYRVITYSLLWVLFRMLRGEDYIEYRTQRMTELRASSASLSLQLSEKFNDDRISLNQAYQAERKELEDKLQEVDRVVKGWERKARLTIAPGYKFYPAQSVDSEGSSDEEGSSSSRPQEEQKSSQGPSYISRPSVEVFAKEETQLPLKTRVLQWIVRQVNPIVHREFLSKLHSSQGEDHVFRLSNLDYVVLGYSVMMSNTQSIAVFMLLLNHFIYASLESIVLPLTVLCYVLLESPRPVPEVWRVLLIYTEGVVFAKYILQLEIWAYLDTDDHLQDYRDQAKLGMNLAKNTYSESMFAYIILDILVILAIIIHRHFLITAGLDNHSEFELESLHEAKLRQLFSDQEFAGFEQFSFDSQWDGKDVKWWRKVKLFFVRLLPIYKEEKPGKDYYVYALWCQIVVLVFLFCFYTNMTGQDSDIGSSFS